LRRSGPNRKVSWLIKAYSIGVDECAFTVELALVKVAFVDDSVGEGEVTDTLLPVILLGAFVF